MEHDHYIKSIYNIRSLRLARKRKFVAIVRALETCQLEQIFTTYLVYKDYKMKRQNSPMLYQASAAIPDFPMIETFCIFNLADIVVDRELKGVMRARLNVCLVQHLNWRTFDWMDMRGKYLDVDGSFRYAMLGALHRQWSLSNLHNSMDGLVSYTDLAHQHRQFCVSLLSVPGLLDALDQAISRVVRLGRLSEQLDGVGGNVSDGGDGRPMLRPQRL